MNIINEYNWLEYRFRILLGLSGPFQDPDKVYDDTTTFYDEDEDKVYDDTTTFYDEDENN